MQDPDTTFDDLKALRLVCRSLDAICSRRVLTSIRLFGCDVEDVPGNFRHLNGVLSCNRLLPASTLVIPDWPWIYPQRWRFFRLGDTILPFTELRGTGGMIALILINTFLVPIYHSYRIIRSPKILPVGVFHWFIRLRAQSGFAFANKIALSNIRRVE
jgi:hypothetical protein